MPDPALIGLYVHWPYCARICPYCDFNVYKNKPADQAALAEAILRDMRAWRQMSGPRRLASIHFGGGTPSLLPPVHMADITQQARALWQAVPDLEIALEANPNDITKDRLAAWRAAGIERISIGVQSFDDSALKFLGRDHNGAQALAALHLAAGIMPRVSADFIFGLAGHANGTEILRADLNTALRAGIGHISAYQLTIEERTAFARAEARGQARACDNELSADLFALAGQVLGAAGFARYEVSNFAKTPADQARHNLLYWQGEDYAGIGPGAHGRLTNTETNIEKNSETNTGASGAGRTATIAHKTPGAYIRAVRDAGTGIDISDTLSPQASAEEYVLMGLRLSGGINLDRLSAIHAQALNTEAAEFYIRQGLLIKQGGHLRASTQGRLVLDRLCTEILA